MDVALYTGNNTARSITGLGFSPDFVWIKGRSGATDHALYDIVRGAQLDLVSNSTAAETTQTTGLTAFNSDGFSIGTLAKLNTNAATYAAWTWDAGTTTATNDVGSISSQVRANASAGFSVVTWTGNGTQGATIGHGLGVSPRLLIFKRRDNGTGESAWWTYHASVTSPNANWWRNYGTLNGTAAFADWGGDSALAAAPSSTLLTVGNYPGFNANGGTFVAYCFAPVAGYSSFGSYTGNGSADGPFVYTGFRPRFILFKNASATSGWNIFDTARDTYNAADKYLVANSSVVESSGTPVFDILSNGFKVRNTWTDINGSGNSIIYAAFAESPFGLNNRAR
jgi:hypothetical protein